MGWEKELQGTLCKCCHPIVLLDRGPTSLRSDWLTVLTRLSLIDPYPIAWAQKLQVRTRMILQSVQRLLTNNHRLSPFSLSKDPRICNPLAKLQELLERTQYLDKWPEIGKLAGGCRWPLVPSHFESTNCVHSPDFSQPGRFRTCLNIFKLKNGYFSHNILSILSLSNLLHPTRKVRPRSEQLALLSQIPNFKGWPISQDAARESRCCQRTVPEP